MYLKLCKILFEKFKICMSLEMRLGVKMKRLRAEWEKQRAILMAFPHKNSDWLSCLEDARDNFMAIIEAILEFESVVLCVDPLDIEGDLIIREVFSEAIRLQRLRIYRIAFNDTWARDFGVLTLDEGDKNALLDFMFNGWGLKFASNLDNAVNRALKENGEFGEEELRNGGMILEGGSIESDGSGVILTNTQCLLESNRNSWLSQIEIEEKLKQTFGAKKILWLHSGYLAGDDTDSHIDTLARFISPTQIAYIACDDENDEHYEELCKMEQELRELRDLQGRAYELIKLPFVAPIYDSKQRLPATYANFLFVNGGLLVPVYGDEKDALALEILQNALPHLKVLGIPCQTLIKQHGSLHCVTMQLY